MNEMNIGNLEIDNELELRDLELDTMNVGGTDDHSQLTNLDYASSGHTGFASSEDLEDYVEKEEGKGLSTNDYTTAEKTKLAGLNNYDDTEVRSLINAKYTKPQSGIPASDLASGVIPDISGKEDTFRYETMPTASSSNVGKIVEYIGAIGDYTKGYFYECVDTSTQESITATQTDNVVPLGTITVDNNTLKSQLSAGTHEFYYRPYDTVLNFMNMSVFPPVSYQVTRDNTFDRQPMIPNAPKLYSWVDGSNNFYVTDTLQPNALTKLYLLDIQTYDLTDTGATFISSNTPSQIEGRWTKKEGDIYTDVEISNYGILLSSAGLPGNTISVNYVEANTSYTWQQKNVQPSGSGGSSNFDDLTNRPSYNGTTITHTTNIPEVKTATWDGKVDDVQVNGTSILSSGVANIPIASTSTAGVAKVSNTHGTGIGSNNQIYLVQATNNEINSRTTSFKPITPNNLDYAVRSVIPVVATTVPATLEVNKIYDLGEQSSLSLTLPSGVVGNFIEVQFISGSTPTSLTITSTSGLSETDINPEANTIYSMFMEWIKLDSNSYGWGISYIDYIKSNA